MATTVQSNTLAVGMAQALAQLGLVSPASKIKYLRHPLLLWHPGGRRYSPRPETSARQPWTTRFIGVSMRHLQALGLSPSQAELDEMTDEEIHAKAGQLYASRLYFPGGFAAYLRVPAPSRVEDGAYDVQALRRFTWSMVKKVGSLDPGAVYNGVFQGLTLPFTRADAREVYPGARRRAEEVDALWESLLSTARVPTVHLVGNPAAGFLIDIGTSEDRLVERVDLLWTSRSAWRTEGRTSSADISVPASQVLLAAGTVRAILSRTGFDEQSAPVWDPKLWEEVCGFLDGLPEHARCMALHLLLADSMEFQHLQKDQAMDYAYQILGLAPPPYEDRRQRFEVDRSLKRAIRDLFEAANDHAPDCLQGFFASATGPLLPWITPSGTTHHITSLEQQIDDDQSSAALASDQMEHPTTARQIPHHSPTLITPQPDAYPSVARRISIECMNKEESYEPYLPTYQPTHSSLEGEGRLAGGSGVDPAGDAQELPRPQVAPELEGQVSALWDLEAFGDWDQASPSAQPVLDAMWAYFCPALGYQPLERGGLEAQAKRIWTVEGLWALLQTLRQLTPEKSLRAARRVMEPWLRGEFMNAMPTAGKVLHGVAVALPALRAELQERRAGQGSTMGARHGARIRALQGLGLAPVPMPMPAPKRDEGVAVTEGTTRAAGAQNAPGEERAASSDGDARWSKIRSALREELSDASYAEWIAPLRVVSLVGQDLLLWAPSPSTKLWIEQQLREEVSAAQVKTGQGDLRIEISHA
jgi:hypothetical protein